MNAQETDLSCPMALRGDPRSHKTLIIVSSIPLLVTLPLLVMRSSELSKFWEIYPIVLGIAGFWVVWLFWHRVAIDDHFFYYRKAFLWTVRIPIGSIKRLEAINVFSEKAAEADVPFSVIHVYWDEDRRTAVNPAVFSPKRFSQLMRILNSKIQGRSSSVSEG